MNYIIYIVKGLKYIPKIYKKPLDELHFVWNKLVYKNEKLYELILILKKENGNGNKIIINKEKTINILDNEKYNLYIRLFPNIGNHISQMRKGCFIECKKKLLELNDNIINIICKF